ncbi:MAG TPA: FmdB family zinc ribbon protein [Nitrospira sp.]|jgi:putative FmdB family regulatory protein|nr:FmdB family zinc ribbon protein [Nitrospira sp.]
MPIYEYSCQKCRKRSSFLIMNPRHPRSIVCRHCGSSKLERLLSRFAVPMSEESRLESLADPANLDGLDESDPRSVARLMKKMGEEMGEDVSDVEAMLEQPGDDDAGPIEHSDSF